MPSKSPMPKKSPIEKPITTIANNLINQIEQRQTTGGKEPKKQGPRGKNGTKKIIAVTKRINHAKNVYLGITKPAIRRLARRGGVKRISHDIYNETRNQMKGFLDTIIRDAVTYTESARRKTVYPVDIISALKRNGRTLLI